MYLDLGISQTVTQPAVWAWETWYSVVWASQSTCKRHDLQRLWYLADGRLLFIFNLSNAESRGTWKGWRTFAWIRMNCQAVVRRHWLFFFFFLNASAEERTRREGRHNSPLASQWLHPLHDACRRETAWVFPETFRSASRKTEQPFQAQSVSHRTDLTSLESKRTPRDFPRLLFLYPLPSAAARTAPNGVKERASFSLVFQSLNTTSSLLHKLSCVGLSKNTLSWFTAFLQSRKQCVQIDGQKSSWQVTKSGIPQGTVLGPTLFLIYINDFPSCIDNDVSIFADDTTVYTIGLPINQNATAISLTADLNNADLWARIWGMLFNADKSEILSIRSQRAAASLQESDPVIHPISMNGVRVPACQKHKHLGVVINNSLSWSDHIDDVFTKCARHVGILNSLRKKLSKRCLTRIYKGYIRPRLEYACAVWSGGNTSKLLKLQQKFCRQHQVQLPNLSDRFKFHTLTLFYKIRNGLAPTYLSEILPETLALSSGRNLRRHVYPFPRINKSSTMQSFLPRATVFWNELPASIQSSSSLHSFKAKLRDLLKI